MMPHLPNLSRKDDPEQRSQLLSRILDPEYTGHSPLLTVGSLRPRSPSLPQPSVFVDRWGDQHDPDFRPFGSHPVLTPLEEPQRPWPWNDDDDDNEPVSPMRPTSLTSGRMSLSNMSSPYHSSLSSGSRSGTRSRSASALPSPPSEPESTQDEIGRKRILPPAHIPRSALFPWTPAQRAARIQRDINKRGFPPPPVFLEEDETEGAPLTLVDSRYVPGYGHFTAPPPQTAPEASKEGKRRYFGRARAHTAPASPQPQLQPEAIDTDDEPEPQSPVSSCSHSLRQSVYSFGLRTRLGLHHIKNRVRRASSAAKRPLSL